MEKLTVSRIGNVLEIKLEDRTPVLRVGFENDYVLIEMLPSTPKRDFGHIWNETAADKLARARALRIEENNRG